METSGEALMNINVHEVSELNCTQEQILKKMTLRPKKQMKKSDIGWRRSADPELLDILLTEGDEYKLVFLSSDSSSKEEDPDDSNSVSTCSSFPIDECDWDYFEPGVKAPALTSPIDSPTVSRKILPSPPSSPVIYRKNQQPDAVIDNVDNMTTKIDANISSIGDSCKTVSSEFIQESESAMEDVSLLQCVHQGETMKTTTPQRQTPCRTCGCSIQYVPIPVPIPIPIPDQWLRPESPLLFYSPEVLESFQKSLRILPRALCAYLNQAASIWPLLNATYEPNSFISSVHNASFTIANSQKTTVPNVKQTQQSVKKRQEDRVNKNAENVENIPKTREDVLPIRSEDEADPSSQHLHCEYNSMNSSTSSADEDESKAEYNLFDKNLQQPEDAEKYFLGGFKNFTKRRDSDGSVGSDSEGKPRSPKQRRKRLVRARGTGRSSNSSLDNLIASNPELSTNESNQENPIVSENSSTSDSDTSLLDSDEIKSTDLQKQKKSRVYVVNSATDESSSEQEDNNNGIVLLTHIKSIGEFNQEISPSDNEQRTVISDEYCDKIKTDDEDSSPALSDVSASLHSSDEVLAGNITNGEVREAAARQAAISSEVSADCGGEWNECAGIRSDEPAVTVEGTTRCLSEQAGVQIETVNNNISTENDTTSASRHAARYTSLIMITQDSAPSQYAPVNVVTSDTTTFVPDRNDIVVRHTNWQEEKPTDNSSAGDQGLEGYFTLMLENGKGSNNNESAQLKEQPVVPENAADSENNRHSEANDTATTQEEQLEEDSVTVITGADTLSAVMCLEEGLADDDSWVEELSHGDNSSNESSSSGEEVTLHCTAAIDHEDELRSFQRGNVDFTLYTIIEESCEESEVEQQVDSNKKQRPVSATDLEKYFCYGIGDGNLNVQREDAFSETSSICSESMDSFGGLEDNASSNKTPEPADMSSSRLEKYFLSGFKNFKERGDSDGSVDSDSEGKPSPEQRRKRLVRARTSETNVDSFATHEDTSNNKTPEPADMSSSRLEKYFLSGFKNFKERRDSDGSVGSDSEGKPSPEQRRKRLVRARGTGRSSHSSSLDNLIASNPELSVNETNPENQISSEHSSSSDSDTYDELNCSFDKNDGQFDTVKRKKNKKQRSNGCSSPLIEEPSTVLEVTPEHSEKSPLDEDNIPQLECNESKSKQHSRDSGFIGSNDDLNKDTHDLTANNEVLLHEMQSNKSELTKVEEKPQVAEDNAPQLPTAATLLTRKDSFNNWSSDEETNLMMCKMRQFFKTMVANSNINHAASKPTTPVMSVKDSSNSVPSPRLKNRCKPPQLVYFENELTRLMKTVPGIRDDQVREIVEYLSSEDTWSDSYDSSDYTSSDLEGTAVSNKVALQQQISASCKQIINKFDTSVDDEGDEGDGGILDESQGLNRETAFVYQKLVASFEKMATGDHNDENESTASMHNSPPLIAKVMHHIGSRLVALMHEVSSGESHASNSPKTKYHRRLQQKLSSCSTTTTEDDDSTSDTNLADKLSSLEYSMTAYNLLPRSRSHDLLLSEIKSGQHQSSVTDIAEERETSDCERFSWRGSFESALLATDSRNKLSLIGGEASASALAIAAKRRSAGDLLFSNRSLSREQLDRVRSCGSIGGASSEDKLWVTCTRPTRRRSSVPDAVSCGSGASADGEEDNDEDEELDNRSTLPRSLQSNATVTTNSLPRLPTNTHTANMQKAQSMHHFSQPSVKSARYRPPGFSRNTSSAPLRAVSAPGLQPNAQRRGRNRQQQIHNTQADDNNAISHKSSPKAGTSKNINGNSEEDIDGLIEEYKRTHLSNLATRSDSMLSVYSGTGEERYGSVTVKGQVEFALQYNYKTSDLEIHVKQCKDLAAVDTKRNRSDPYVKVYLLPDKTKSGKRKTKVKKHTLNPVFEECLKYHVPLSELDTRKLWLTVWHSDIFGRNDFLGEVIITLQSKVFDDPLPSWYSLQERSEPFEEPLTFRGDIYLGLKFVPPEMKNPKKGKLSKGSLHVLIKGCKQIIAVKGNGLSDAFCKCYLLPDKGRSSKKKTPIIRKTINPIWHCKFIYEDVSLQELAERCLELTVWDHDILGSNEFIGGVRFSLGAGTSFGKHVNWMDSSGKEVALWKSMLRRPNLWVEGCLPLRSRLEHKGS